MGKEQQKENLLAVLIRRALCAWLAAAALEYLLLPAAARDLEGLAVLQAMSPLRALLVAAGVFGLLCLPPLRRLRGRERYALPLLFAVCAGAGLASSFSKGLLAGCLLVLLLLVVYALRGWDGSAEAVPAGEKPRALWAWLTAAMAVGFFLLVSAWSVARVRSLSVPTYDFGIFSQMFASMRRTGLPVTTLERGVPLSHFTVHLSPIYYLMLPFYWLVPRPETLEVLQAAIMASAVLPLWKLGGLHGLTGPRRFLLCAVLLAAPAFAGGAAFDLHENCFLTVLLLWLLWALDRGNKPVLILSALLTLAVKEDAAVYVGVLGLWVLLRAALRPERRNQLPLGLLLLGGALAWFFIATGWLSDSGEGVMLGRYSNLIYETPNSALTVVKAVLLCPVKALRECLDADKLPYLALTLGPLLGIPLWTRRYERLVLVLPWLLFNLLSDYPYQHSLYYQYSFGSLACLLYLTCVNLEPRRTAGEAPAAAGQKQLPARLRLAALVLAVLVSAGCFAKTVAPQCKREIRLAVSTAKRTDAVREALAELPADAAVAASTFYTVPLSDREAVYDVGYLFFDRLPDLDYVVLSATDRLVRFNSPDAEDGPDRFRDALREKGFAPVKELPGILEIWQRQP